MLKSNIETKKDIYDNLNSNTNIKGDKKNSYISIRYNYKKKVDIINDILYN